MALLLFILGIWIWDHYFGKPGGYAPGTEEVALVKIDRDLRLADAMELDGKWLKFLAGATETEEAKKDALEILSKLAKGNAITPRGLEAYAVIRAVQDDLSVEGTVRNALQGSAISDIGETSRDLANHRGTWWDAKMVENWEETVKPNFLWRISYANDLLQLRTRALVARSSIWILGIIGLAFIPVAIRALIIGVHGTRRNYGDAWTVPLGMVVFLVAILAWIGFTLALELGIGTLSGLHPAYFLFLDSAARLLPPLIAIGLLFRHPFHAVRVMGIWRPVRIRAVLGVFSLLMIADQILQLAVGEGGAGEPGGGLIAGEAGWWGLVSALVSACLLAPVAEETLYRGVLFRSFRNRIGVLPGAVVSSVIFSLMHFYDGFGLLSVGLFGFSCALLYSSTRSLSAVILLHMLYNTAIKLPDWIVYHAPLG